MADSLFFFVSFKMHGRRFAHARAIFIIAISRGGAGSEFLNGRGAWHSLSLGVNHVTWIFAALLDWE